MTEFGRFSAEDAKRIAVQTRRLEALTGNLETLEPPNARLVSARIEGFLVDDLSPATESGTEPTTARMIVWRGKGMKWQPGETVVITNRSDSLSVPTGSYLMALELNGELRPVSGGGGGTLTIRFKIVDEVFCEACTAIAEVISRPPGMATVPEETYGRVMVVDRLGCFLDEPSDSLLNRVGYATYLTVDPAHEAGPCPGLPFTSWEIISLCCYEVCQ